MSSTAQLSTNRRLVRALYREFIELLGGSQASIKLFEPIDIDAVKATLSRPFRYIEHDARRVASLPDVITDQDGCIEPRKLLDAIRKQFRSPQPSPEDMASALDSGFDELRQLRKIVMLQRTHSTLTTSGISVQITTQHVPDSRWVFVYRVRITSNRPQGNVQIRTRHIQVQAGGHRVEERLLGAGAAEFALAGMTGGMTETQPYAAGVVGQQPVLAPHQTFEYFSGTSPVEHCAGTVLGGYGVTDMTTGDVFDVDLPAVGFEDFDCVEGLRERYRRRLDDDDGSDEEEDHRV